MSHGEVEDEPGFAEGFAEAPSPDDDPVRVEGSTAKPVARSQTDRLRMNQLPWTARMRRSKMNAKMTRMLPAIVMKIIRPTTRAIHNARKEVEE